MPAQLCSAQQARLLFALVKCALTSRLYGDRRYTSAAPPLSPLDQCNSNFIFLFLFPFLSVSLISYLPALLNSSGRSLPARATPLSHTCGPPLGQLFQLLFPLSAFLPSSVGHKISLPPSHAGLRRPPPRLLAIGHSVKPALGARSEVRHASLESRLLAQRIPRTGRAGGAAAAAARLRPRPTGP